MTFQKKKPHSKPQVQDIIFHLIPAQDTGEPTVTKLSNCSGLNHAMTKVYELCIKFSLGQL